MFKKLLLGSAVLASAFVLQACSGGSSSTGSSNKDDTATNPMKTLSADVVNHMVGAIPSGSRRATELNILATWTGPVTNMPNPGCTGANVSMKDYTLSVLDSDYECDDFSPTVFGRFSQTMKVLEVIGSQVAISNGVPAVGTHSVTTEVDQGNGLEEVTFNVVITAVSSNANFDVKVYVADLGWTGFIKNRDNVVNFIATEDKGSSSKSFDSLFWNKTTGEMTYTYGNDHQDANNGELQKMVINSTGASRIGHYIFNAGNEVRLVADFPQGDDTAIAGLDFLTTGDAGTFCVDVADMTAGHACTPPDAAAWTTGVLAELTDTPASLLTRVFGGTGSEADMLDTAADFNLANFNTID